MGSLGNKGNHSPSFRRKSSSPDPPSFPLSLFNYVSSRVGFTLKYLLRYLQVCLPVLQVYPYWCGSDRSTVSSCVLTISTSHPTPVASTWSGMAQTPFHLCLSPESSFQGGQVYSSYSIHLTHQDHTTAFVCHQSLSMVGVLPMLTWFSYPPYTLPLYASLVYIASASGSAFPPPVSAHPHLSPPSHAFRVGMETLLSPVNLLLAFLRWLPRSHSPFQPGHLFRLLSISSQLSAPLW